MWQKNTPLATTTKSAKLNDPHSGPSLSSPSKTLHSPVAKQSSTVPIKSREQSSKKDQQLIETGEKNGDMSPKIDQTKPVPYLDGSKLSELRVDREVYKPKQSAATCDDDDLPEYDFRVATSLTWANKPFDGRAVKPKLDAEQFNNCHISLPMPPQMRTERLTDDPIAPPGFHFLGQFPQNIRHQSEPHVLKLPRDPRKPISEQIANQNVTNLQGVAQNNTSHKPQGQIPSLPLPVQKHIGNVPNQKPRKLYDDDMLEWSPPIITNPRQELAHRPVQPIVSNPALHPNSCDNNYRSAPQDPRGLLISQPSLVSLTKVLLARRFWFNPAFQSRFDPPGRNNPIHPTSFRGLGP